MTLSNQIRELAGKVEATYQQGQVIPGGSVADYDMLREHVDAKAGMRDLMVANLSTILAALELAERLDAPGCVEEVARAILGPRDPVPTNSVFSLEHLREHRWKSATPREQAEVLWAAKAAISAMKGERG